MSKRLMVWLIACIAALTACRSADAPTAVRLLTHDSFDISEETVAAFEAATGYRLEIVKSGDAGQMLNQAILAKDNPVADVIFGVDNSFLSRALDNDLLLPAAAADLAPVPAALQLDPEGRALPVDFGDVCLNYDVAWFAARSLAPPTTLADLLDPAYAGLTAVQNPATSSPGLAFLMATVAVFGEDGYGDYWRQLRANGVRVENGWSEAYYGAFTRYGGDRPIVVSYATSPAAEIYFAETPPAAPPTAAVLGPQTCFRQIEFAGVLRGTRQEAEAQQLLAFLLGETFQADIPLHMFVYPANAAVPLPELFDAYAQQPAEPITLDPAVMGANRERWIAEWTRVVLR